MLNWNDAIKNDMLQLSHSNLCLPVSAIDLQQQGWRWCGKHKISCSCWRQQWTCFEASGYQGGYPTLFREPVLFWKGASCKYTRLLLLLYIIYCICVQYTPTICMWFSIPFDDLQPLPWLRATLPSIGLKSRPLSAKPETPCRRPPAMASAVSWSMEIESCPNIVK